MKPRPKIDRFLMERNGFWYYQRAIPNRFAHVDGRKRIRYTLRTESKETARILRDHLATADEEYWNALALEASIKGGVTDATFEAQKHRYVAAQERAIASGFAYKSANRLAREIQTDEQVDRVLKRIEEVQSRVGENAVPEQQDTEALLGGVSEPVQPDVTVSKAFEIYLNEIAFSEMIKK